MFTARWFRFGGSVHTLMRSYQAQAPTQPPSPQCQLDHPQRSLLTQKNTKRRIPPRIAIGQIRLTSQTTATVATTEIYQIVGVHRERSDSPVWKTDFTTGEITFASALPPIHTGNTTKAVTVKGYTPIFAESPRVSDFVPAEESNSVSSTEIYGGTLGSVSKSLGQAKFTHYGNDGITDPLVKAKGQKLWFKFIQDKTKTPYSLTQGILGIARTFPAGKHVQISCTISAEQPTTDFDG